MPLGLQLRHPPPKSPLPSLITSKCFSESPSPKSQPGIMQGKQAHKPKSSKEKVAITHSSRQTSAWRCLCSWKLQHVTAPRPRPWKSGLDLVWMSASLRMRAVSLRAPLTTPLPPQLHYSCKHTAVTSTECVGSALRTLLELPDWQRGLCSLHLPARGWWLHLACFVDPDLLLPCQSMMPASMTDTILSLEPGWGLFGWNT